MTGPQGAYARAASDGRDAYAAGAPVAACPFSPALSAKQARAWTIGWIAARRATGAPEVADLSAAAEQGPAPVA